MQRKLELQHALGRGLERSGGEPGIDQADRLEACLLGDAQQQPELLTRVPGRRCDQDLGTDPRCGRTNSASCAYATSAGVAAAGIGRGNGEVPRSCQ